MFFCVEKPSNCSGSTFFCNVATPVHPGHKVLMASFAFKYAHADFVFAFSLVHKLYVFDPKLYAIFFSVFR